MRNHLWSGRAPKLRCEACRTEATSRHQEVRKDGQRSFVCLGDRRLEESYQRALEKRKRYHAV